MTHRGLLIIIAMKHSAALLGNNMTIPRRQFVAGMGALLSAGQLRAAENEKLRSVVIGHTGKGDYGHGLEMVFADQPRVELVGLADPVDAGRAKVAARCKPLRQYAD